MNVHEPSTGSGAFDRRGFLAVLPTAAIALAALVRPGRAHAARGARCTTHDTRHVALHPDPRPGVDASNVVPDDTVPGRLKELFDLIRAAPAVVDGVRCHCGCADIPGYYSLLSCYEAPGMALHCDVCQAQGLLVGRMARDGAALETVRAAVDEKFA